MQHTPVELFQKYLDNRINRTELEELMAYMGHPENREQLKDWVHAVLTEGGSLQVEQLERLLDGLDDRVLTKVKGLIEAENPASKKGLRRLYLPIAAAIVFLLAIGMGFYLHRYANPTHRAATTTQSPGDIRPGGNRAMLTLEGYDSAIALDSSQVGVAVKDGELRYEDGQLVAELKAGQAAVVRYATLTTPKGGQYRVTLPDGTNVWLNAASSLKYPTHFAGNTREVELVGEGYFEVAKDGGRPFIVTSAGQQVRVLGTQFNVNAYSNEREVTTTLVEGSVDVVDVRSQTSHPLKPGQQAIHRGNVIDIAQVNVSYYTSWKNGRFTFNRAKLPVILRQIERWYDIEFVNNTNGVDVQLWGALSRDVMLSELLEVLELNTGMKFKREGRKVIMSQ